MLLSSHTGTSRFSASTSANQTLPLPLLPLPMTPLGSIKSAATMPHVGPGSGFAGSGSAVDLGSLSLLSPRLLTREDSAVSLDSTGSATAGIGSATPGAGEGQVTARRPRAVWGQGTKIISCIPLLSYLSIYFIVTVFQFTFRFLECLFFVLKTFSFGFCVGTSN